MIVVVKRNKNLKLLKIAIALAFTMAIAFFLYNKFQTKQEELKSITEKQEIISLLGYKPETLDEWSYSDLKEYLAYLHFIKRGTN